MARLLTNRTYKRFDDAAADALQKSTEAARPIPYRSQPVTHTLTAPTETGIQVWHYATQTIVKDRVGWNLDDNLSGTYTAPILGEGDANGSIKILDTFMAEISFIVSAFSSQGGSTIWGARLWINAIDGDGAWSATTDEAYGYSYESDYPISVTQPPRLRQLMKGDQIAVRLFTPYNSWAVDGSTRATITGGPPGSVYAGTQITVKAL
mgnify:CR=1 FL=1